MSKIKSWISEWMLNAFTRNPESPVPDEIDKLAFKNYMFSFIFFIVVFSTLIIEKRLMYLVMLIVPLAFIIRGINYRYMWNVGQITEIVIKCTSVTNTRRGVRIIGHNTEDKYYEYYVSTNNISDFVVDYVYVCYSTLKSPHNLLAYRPM